MQNPLNTVELVMGSFVPFTNCGKWLLVGTPIFSLFPFVGISHPLGTKVVSPGHVIGLSRSFQVVKVVVVACLWSTFFKRPCSFVQYHMVLPPWPFTLTISSTDGCSSLMINRKSPERPLNRTLESVWRSFGPY